MKVRSVSAAAAAALVLAGAPAAAQSPDEDVKCFIASNLFTRAEKDPTRNRVAVLASYFFLGRVDAKLSGQQLAAALKAQSAAITPETAGPIMTACAKRLQGVTVAIQTIGKDLNAKTP